MNQPLDPDPLDLLRAADPVSADDLPSASLARIRARVSEDVMATRTAPRKVPWRTRSVAWLAGAGGAIAVGIAALAFAFGIGGTGPGVVPGTSVGPGSAMCVEQYSPTTLARRAFAFDGTVAAIDGDRVTFTVNRAYRAAAGPSITLVATGMTGTAITSAGGPTLVVGQRYLVAGEADLVWACGFTQPWDATVAAQWAAAFGS